MNGEQKPKGRKWWLADVNLFLVVLIWGINLPIMKYALAEIDKYAFNALRLLLSAIALGIIAVWMKAPLFDSSPGAKPVKSQVFHLVIFSMLTAFGYQVLFLLGIDSTSAGNTGLILSAIPMWIAILSLIFLKERLSLAAWSGLMIAIAGVLVVTLSKLNGNSGTNSLYGNVLVSLAAFSWAIGTVMSKPIVKNISPIALTFFAISITLPLHFLITKNVWHEVQVIVSDSKLTLAILYSGIFSTGLATAMWNIGVKQVGPSHAAGFQNLVPLIALGASWMLIGEIPFFVQILGGLLIIVGLVVMRMQRKAIAITS